MIVQLDGLMASGAVKLCRTKHYLQIRQRHSLVLIAATLMVLTSACNDSETSETTAPNPWENYSVQPPSEEMVEILQQSPAIYPNTFCAPYEATAMSVDSQYLESNGSAGADLCIWHHPAGCVPEGQNYADLASCDVVRTLGPSWFVPPIRRFESDPSLLEDPDYVRELAWVTEQVAASGCACCHASERSNYASFFDIDAPGSWIDTLTMTGVVMAAGMNTEHKYLGYLPPDDNFGFDRETTLFATTDIPRMTAFFTDEFERRGGTQEDVERAGATFRQINGSLYDEPTECGPGEGMNADGKIVWKGGAARQVYLQTVGSQNPGSPPNLDKPAGTLWALYADNESDGLVSGTVTPGEVPNGARQAVPADPDLVASFEAGTQYRLFVTPDFLRSNTSNCIFTFGEASADPDTQNCGSENTLCARVLIPEDLTETPEKLLVALYRTLPPLGPPDVFPPYSVDEPSLTPRTTVDVQLDAAVTGTYQVYAVLYMPGGGLSSWQPVPGIDYVAASEPIELDGSGQVISAPLVFEYAE